MQYYQMSHFWECGFHKLPSIYDYIKYDYIKYNYTYTIYIYICKFGSNTEDIYRNVSNIRRILAGN